MANQYGTNPIVLDTFSSLIDLASSCGFAPGTPFKVNSIEWQTPTTVGHTALITDKASGNTIFSETATVANQSVIKYFYGAWVTNLYIASSGVQSGVIVITLA
jgi:hypothetical protein